MKPVPPEIMTVFPFQAIETLFCLTGFVGCNEKDPYMLIFMDDDRTREGDGLGEICHLDDVAGDIRESVWGKYTYFRFQIPAGFVADWRDHCNLVSSSQNSIHFVSVVIPISALPEPFVLPRAFPKLPGTQNKKGIKTQK